METRSYSIPASAKSLVEEQLNKLNKRAEKIGLEQITWAFGKAYLGKRTVLYRNPEYPDLQPQYIEKEILIIPIDITGPLSVTYDGWSFVATLQHLPTGENIIRNISNQDVPLKYREANSNCDHCKVNRYRKDTYLLFNEEKGFMQVGSTCMKDFLGENSPDLIIQKANLISQLSSFMDGIDDMEFGLGRGKPIFHIKSFLIQTVICIKKFGWLSKSKAEEVGGTPTVYCVLESMSNDMTSSTDMDINKASSALDWAENLSDEATDNSEYLYNIRAIARSGMVTERTAGYAASIISAYDRYLLDKSNKNNSQHVGTLKKREYFSLTLKQHLVYDGYYGTTHKYIFHDNNGNVLVWNASSHQDLDVDKTYLIKGTVKDHTNYKGVNQTILSRCTIENN